MSSNQFVQLKLKLFYFVRIIRNSTVTILCCVLAHFNSLSTGEVYYACISTFWQLACFSHSHFSLTSFTLQLASAPFPVSLWWGVHSWTKVLVETLKRLHASEEKWCHLYCSYTIQSQKHPQMLFFQEELPGVHWFNVNMSINYTYQEQTNCCHLLILMFSALTKFTAVN